MAEQGLIEPAQLDARLASVETGDPAAVVRAAAAVVPAGLRPDDPLMVSAGWSAERRSGVWVIPPYLHIHPAASNVRLDCLRARVNEPVIQVELSGGMGSVLFILPDGWAVNADRLTRGMGSVRIKVPGIAAPGCPTLVFRGSTSMGSVVVRPANRWERRRLAREIS